MFYRAVAATCPGNNKEYNSNNIYLNSKYIAEEYKASEILLRQKREQEGLQFYAIAEGRGADRYSDEASLIAIKKLSDFHKKALENEISKDYDAAADVLYSYVEEYIKEANEAVIAKATELPEKDIHTSIATVAIYEKALITCNLGNTKIFLQDATQPCNGVPCGGKLLVTAPCLHCNKATALFYKGQAKF